MRLTTRQAWYKDYLASQVWEKKKKQILRRRPYVCQISWCGRYWGLQFHHLSYEHLGDEREGDIVILCPLHHWLCHYTFLGRRIPLTPNKLRKRYRYLSRASWRRLRPSDLFGWFYKTYRIV